MSNEISLVTGANGHLGNNLVRLLLSENHKVRATTRNIDNLKPFEGSDCEVVQADITDRESLRKAFKGITKLPAHVDNGYNRDRRNWYYNSKNDSDKLAIELGKKYGIRTVIILPSAMIGSKAFKLSYTNNLVYQILNGEIPVDTNVTLNWIDVKDVAFGAYRAMQKGKNGERYILANEQHTTLQESVKIASELYPELKLQTPKKVPKCLLYSVAGLMEFGSKLTGKEPLLQRHYLDMFYGLKQDYDITKSRQELGFNPKSSKIALIDALEYLKNNWEKEKA